MKQKKKSGKAGSFPPKRNCINEGDWISVLVLGDFIAKPPLQITQIT